METLETKTPISSKAVWMEAMKYGALLGLVTVAFEFLPKLWQPDTATLLAEGGSKVTSALTATLISVLYFIVKTGVCVWLMVVFTKKLVALYDNVTRSHTFRFGMFMALFSGLITGATMLLQLKLMDNGAISEMVQSVMEAQSQSVPADMAESISNTVIDILPFFTFLLTVSKCFLIGLLASSIISRSVPGRTANPFEQR